MSTSKTPRELAGIDPDFLLEFGHSTIQYHPPYMAVRDGRWAVYEAWKVLRGPNTGACQYQWRWFRWWHPGDLWLFVNDRRKVHREFGSAWRRRG